MKEGRLKRYGQRVKQSTQNRTFQNNKRKFYKQVGGDDTKIYQQPDASITEEFGIKLWQPREHNKNAEWISNMTKESELEEDPKAEIHINLLKTTHTHKKKSIWKTTGHDGIYGFWFKKFTSIHDRLALEEAHVPDWMTSGKATSIQKDLTRGNRPKQLQTHTDYAYRLCVKFNSTNKGRDLQLAKKPRIVP